jgi:iron(III) transport system ATP-binding protein|tara:strand:- start:702 stop:1730 length:1029 start_codon:yes stop_codon:yes gene_type:complete
MTFNGLEISEVSAELGGKRVLQSISFSLKSGNVLAVLGPSGCGKSTLLKVIAGIVNPTDGHIFWNSADILNTPSHKRGIGLMFQNNALFPHMSVHDNIRFGLEMLSVPKDEANDRTVDLLELVDLKGYGNRAVDSLSGGESQRVALARVLAPEPKLVLLDEPFNSLDRALRRSLVEQVFEILRAKKITSIHVTHEGDEASLFSNSILIIEDGQVINKGTFTEIINSPMNVVSAELLGLRTVWAPDAHFRDGTWSFSTPFGSIEYDGSESERYQLLLRPEHIQILNNGLEGVVTKSFHRAGQKYINCSVGNIKNLTVLVDSDISVGESIYLAVDLDSIEVLVA